MRTGSATHSLSGSVLVATFLSMKRNLFGAMAHISMRFTENGLGRGGQCRGRCVWEVCGRWDVFSVLGLLSATQTVQMPRRREAQRHWAAQACLGCIADLADLVGKATERVQHDSHIVRTQSGHGTRGPSSQPNCSPWSSTTCRNIPASQSCSGILHARRRRDAH